MDIDIYIRKFMKTNLFLDIFIKYLIKIILIKKIFFYLEWIEILLDQEKIDIKKIHLGGKTILFSALVNEKHVL